ncbi:putative Tubulin tyrosine ligase family [Trypanosoma vivax]|nr:putative Tubulin tyrosine ligase family [Trypanosoma vivax]
MKDFASFHALLDGWFEAHAIPVHLRVRLFEKLKNDVFDAGSSFALTRVSEGDAENEGNAEDESNAITDSSSSYVLVTTRDVKANEDIWLVDHFCTFRLREFRRHLMADESLRKRLNDILSLPLSHADEAADTQSIFDCVWKKVWSYRLPSSPDDGVDDKLENYWFIHDEVGCAIIDITSGNGNMKLEPIPLCFPEKGGVFSVMWCVEDMEEGTIATRRATTVLEAVGGKEVLTLMYGDDGPGGSTDDGEAYRAAQRVCVNAWRQHMIQLRAAATAVPSRQPAAVQMSRLHSSHPSVSPLRVFTDSQQVSSHLTDARHFVVVDLPQEAHVVWISHRPIDSLDEFKHAYYISQFPEERFFTSKSGLLEMIQKRLGHVSWYQVGYDTTTHLREFIGDFIVRQGAAHRSECDGDVVLRDDVSQLLSCDGTNLWISKPANMARSIDMAVSANFSELLKTIETGPKVVSKYIANCATLRQRKFDLRFIVCVNSFSSAFTELEAYVYNVFWTRFALEDYKLDEFDCYEKHWTVMNYSNPEKLLKLYDTDFIREFNDEYAPKGYGSFVWEAVVYPKILKMLREVFSLVTLEERDRRRCRGMYGVDVMVRIADAAESGGRALEPSLLEITFSPDCRRACEYNPSFFNDVFHTLFRGQPVNMTRL